MDWMLQCHIVMVIVCPRTEMMDYLRSLKPDALVSNSNGYCLSERRNNRFFEKKSEARFFYFLLFGTAKVRFQYKNLLCQAMNENMNSACAKRGPRPSPS